MTKMGFRRNIEPLKVLSDAEVEAIHGGALKVLERTGVAITEERALRLLEANGCLVDRGEGRVRFPPDLVDECIAVCPSSFMYRSRDPEKSLEIGEPNTTYFIPSQGLNTVDLDSWRPRRPTRKEFYDQVKLIDALPTIHGHTCFPWFGFDKVPEAMALLESNAAKIRWSTKVQVEGAVMGNERFHLAMARATDQDVLQLTNPAAPLAITDDTVAKILLFAENDVPFNITPGPVGGATGPATIAGMLISNNAAFLAAMTLAQLHRPGARIVNVNMCLQLDMRSGVPFFAQAGNFLHDTAFHQVSRHLGLPTLTTASGNYTGSKMMDIQAGAETAMGATCSILSGPSMLSLHGGLTQQKVLHPLKLVLDDDIAGMLGRFIEGIEVDDETMALDLIDSVGPLPGTFLTTSHTRKWWRHEQYVPKSTDHLPYEQWVDGGSKGALDHARDRMEEILMTYEPTPLLPAQEEAIEGILQEAREYYRRVGLISDDEWRLYQEDLKSPDYPYA